MFINEKDSTIEALSIKSPTNRFNSKEHTSFTIAESPCIITLNSHTAELNGDITEDSSHTEELSAANAAQNITS